MLEGRWSEDLQSPYPFIILPEESSFDSYRCNRRQRG